MIGEDYTGVRPSYLCLPREPAPAQPGMNLDPAQRLSLSLERQIRDERSDALGRMHAAYEQLAQALVEGARSRGWLGADPLEALRVVLAPDAQLHQLGAAAGDLWLAFFTCFRTDEQAFEAQTFRTLADELNRRLAQVPAGGRPDPQLTIDLLIALEQLWHQRHEVINQRLDQLIGELGTNQAQLGSAQLFTAHAQDEISRAMQVLEGAAVAAGLALPANEQALDRLTRILAHYRGLSQTHETAARETTKAFALFLKAVRAVATRGEVPALPPEAQAVVDIVRSLDDARRENEKAIRELKGHVATLEAQRRELLTTLERRERRITTLEHGDASTDERLALYRQAFAQWETGGDPRAVLEQVRTIERVVVLAKADAEQVVKALDRCHADLVRGLADLHAVLPLIDDPKRYRPRTFLGFGGKSDYDLKSVPGLAEALRDGGRDLRLYADRARWAVGVQDIARQVARIRAVFKELVKLVAHWREKLGDPPPVSISISLDGSSGVLALPAVVATDLEAMLKRKTKVGPAALVLAPILEDCVALYHATVCQAKGTAIARSQPSAKRESPIQQVTRLTAELSDLAGTCEAAFGEAAQRDFILEDPDARLLAEEHLLRGTLTVLDTACAELLGHRGVPPAVPGSTGGALSGGKPGSSFPALPPKKDIAGIRDAIELRVSWWEDVARYRFAIG